MKESEVLEKILIMSSIYSKFLFEQFKKKIENSYVPKDVFYETYKHRLCHTFIEARRLFAITYVLEIHIFAFRPNPWEIV